MNQLQLRLMAANNVVCGGEESDAWLDHDKLLEFKNMAGEWAYAINENAGRAAFCFHRADGTLVVIGSLLQ